MIERPSVDYFAYSDGEVAFLELVKKFISLKCKVLATGTNDEKLAKLKKSKLEEIIRRCSYKNLDQVDLLRT